MESERASSEFLFIRNISIGVAKGGGKIIGISSKAFLIFIFFFSFFASSDVDGCCVVVVKSI